MCWFSKSPRAVLTVLTPPTTSSSQVRALSCRKVSLLRLSDGLRTVVSGCVTVISSLFMSFLHFKPAWTIHHWCGATLAQRISSHCEAVHWRRLNPTFRDGHHNAERESADG